MVLFADENSNHNNFLFSRRRGGCMYKKKIATCKEHGPQSWCQLFVTLTVIFIWKKLGELWLYTFLGILLRGILAPLIFFQEFHYFLLVFCNLFLTLLIQNWFISIWKRVFNFGKDFMKVSICFLAFERNSEIKTSSLFFIFCHFGKLFLTLPEIKINFLKSLHRNIFR